MMARPRIKAGDRVRVVGGRYKGHTGIVVSQFTDGFGSWIVLIDGPKSGDSLPWIKRDHLEMTNTRLKGRDAPAAREGERGVV